MVSGWGQSERKVFFCVSIISFFFLFPSLGSAAAKLGSIEWKSELFHFWSILAETIFT